MNRLQLLQPYLVLIYNCHPRNDEHRECLRLIHEQLPNARYIVAVKSALAAIASLLPGDLPFGAEWLAIRSFNRARVRRMVKNYQLPAHFHENQVIEDLGARFSALSVPFAGPQIAMYLSILSTQKRFTPINASTVIELFVEQLLEKPNLKDIFRVAVDYREKADLLGVVAEHFIRNDVDTLSYDELYSLMQGYYTGIGIPRNVADLVQYFLQVGAFDRIGNSITFRYNIVFSFFVAYRMLHSAEFRKFIMEFGRFTSFIHEIDIYCGLSRADVETLQIVSSHFEILNKEAKEELGKLMNYNAIVEMKLPRQKDFRQFVDELTRSITDELDQDEADMHSDRRATFAQRLQRPALKNVLVRWIFALRAYSVCIKNLEVIDKELKRQHLTKLFDSWASAVALAVKVAAICFEEGKVEFAGIKLLWMAANLWTDRSCDFSWPTYPDL